MIDTHKQKIVIIGAGPCGMGAAWRLNELGYSNVRIYEATDRMGGLAISPTDTNGFTWDLGGHVLHSHYAYFDNVFETVMGGEYVSLVRSAWIWMHGKMIPYPLQNNIHHLPDNVFQHCLRGYRDVLRGKKMNPKNYTEWVVSSFGKGLADHFHLPYARKVWAHSPDTMSASWVGDRVALSNVEKLIKRVEKGKDESDWGPNHIFKYPKKGGNGELWNRMGEYLEGKIDIHFSKKAVRINIRAKKVYFSDGTTDTYDLLLTTIPLDVLAGLCESIRLPRLHLVFSTVHLVGIGVQGIPPRRLQDVLWCYFPEKTVPFFRVTLLSNFSESMSPQGTWSLLCEISSSKTSPLPDGSIIQRVKDGLQQCGFLEPQDVIVDEWMQNMYRGYPVPTVLRDRYVHQVLEALEPWNVYSRGRFGAWKYEVSNQDHTFMQGVEWVNRMLLNEPEVTIHNPNYVNKVRVDHVLHQSQNIYES